MKLAPREREHAGLLPRLENESAGDVEFIGESAGELDAAELIGESPVPGDIEPGVRMVGSVAKVTFFSVLTERLVGSPKAGGPAPEFGCQLLICASDTPCDTGGCGSGWVGC